MHRITQTHAVDNHYSIQFDLVEIPESALFVIHSSWLPQAPKPITRRYRAELQRCYEHFARDLRFRFGETPWLVTAPLESSTSRCRILLSGLAILTGVFALSLFFWS